METKTVKIDLTPGKQKIVEAAAKKLGLTVDQFAAKAIEEHAGPKVTIEPDLLTVLQRISIKLGISKDKIVNYILMDVIPEETFFTAASGLFKARNSEELSKLERQRESLKAEIVCAFEKWKAEQKA